MITQEHLQPISPRGPSANDSGDLELQKHEIDHSDAGKDSVEESPEEVAQRGHAATDKHGHALVHFDPKEEARLRLKIDLYVVPTVFILYLFAFIDRANIGNANIAGFGKDLKLKGYDYNVILSSFYVSYILFEIPSSLACKYFGPGKFLPATTVGFGILSLVTAFVHNKNEACGVRFVLGIFEAGMLPGIAYYLSRWYRKSELVFRLAMYIVAAPLAGAFGGLLAGAIIKLPGFGIVHTWRMLFFVEGIITVALGLIAFVTLTDRPATARWLNEREKAIAIGRVKSELVGATEVLDKMDTKKTLAGIFNPSVLLIGTMFGLINVTVQGLAFFLPRIIATLYPHNSVSYQQVRTVPPYLVAGTVTVIVPFIAWKTNRRAIYQTGSSVCVMIGYIMFLVSKKPEIRYGATFIIASGAFNFGSLSNAYAAANTLSDTSRSAAIGTVVMFGNLGGLVSTWSFLPFDGPDYVIGNSLNLGTSTGIFIISILLLLWQKYDNRRRDKIDVDAALAGMSVKEIQDLDWKHPGFRWKY